MLAPPTQALFSVQYSAQRSLIIPPLLLNRIKDDKSMY